MCTPQIAWQFTVEGMEREMKNKNVFVVVNSLTLTTLVFTTAETRLNILWIRNAIGCFPKVKSRYPAENRQLHYCIWLQNCGDVLEISTVADTGLLQKNNPSKRRDLPRGRKSTCEFDSYVVSQNEMITRYARDGRIEDAHQLFDKMHKRSIVSWNAMITGYAYNGRINDARQLFDEMLERDVVSWNAMISGYIRNGRLKDAHELFDKMAERDVISWNSLISGYARSGNMETARQLFDMMPGKNLVSWNAVLVGYVQSGRMEEARHLFDKMLERDAVSWNTMITAYAQNGKMLHARLLFDAMPHKNTVSWNVMVTGYAQAGKILDARHLFDAMPVRDVISWTAIVAAYAQNDNINDARQLFDKMPKQSVFLWNEIIRGYVRYGFYEEALALYHQMQHFNVIPNNFTFPCVLKACAGLSDLQQGREIHDLIMRSRLESDHFVGNALVAMYAKCGRLEDARHIFDKMPQRNVVSWNAMIAGYAQHGHGNEALELFRDMQRVGVILDSFTMATVLSVSSRMGSLQQGKRIHACVVRGGFEWDVFVSSALVDMYAKCGNMDDASQLFDKMSQRNVVSWNAMMTGYAQNGCHSEALNILRQMKQTGEMADSVTIGCALSACAQLQALQQGKEIHNNILRTGLELDVFVSSALLDMYAKCGNLENAVEVFDSMCYKNVVTWNAMIAGYAQNGHESESLDFFYKMLQAGEKPDSTTVASILPVCAHLSALQNGREIHSYIYSSGLESDIYVGCALIDMYCKCKIIEHAHKVFDKIYKRDAVQWTALIAGYAQNGQGDQAIKLFHQMQVEGIKPTSTTIASVLPICADLTALRKGKEIHNYILRNGFESDVFVGSALVDTYAKCGSIEAAHWTFDRILHKNVVSWNTIIAGYGMHGYGEDALKLFHDMQKAGTYPNYITFIAILSACSHAGLVDKGWQYFESMSHQYGIIPMVEHYTCMVDILGRAGLLDEALDFIKKMPLQPDAGLWGALLGACRIHCNVEIGQYVAQHIFELEPQDTGYYVLMSNMYAVAGRWDEAKRVRTLMKDKWLNKNPGCSWIEVKKKVYAFVARDRSYPQSQEIHAMLENLAGQMKEVGYEPARNFALQDVEDEDKYFGLCCHSEKLAIAFGLINEFPGISIRVTKNLRVCGDCHTATKFISKIVRREIIVRDASRFHHFKDGACACRDYW